jgi:hypothetical protein
MKQKERIKIANKASQNCKFDNNAAPSHALLGFSDEIKEHFRSASSSM